MFSSEHSFSMNSNRITLHVPISCLVKFTEWIVQIVVQEHNTVLFIYLNNQRCYYLEYWSFGCPNTDNVISNQPLKLWTKKNNTKVNANSSTKLTYIHTVQHCFIYRKYGCSPAILYIIMYFTTNVVMNLKMANNNSLIDKLE